MMFICQPFLNVCVFPHEKGSVSFFPLSLLPFFLSLQNLKLFSVLCLKLALT